MPMFVSPLVLMGPSEASPPALAFHSALQHRRAAIGEDDCTVLGVLCAATAEMGTAEPVTLALATGRSYRRWPASTIAVGAAAHFRHIGDGERHNLDGSKSIRN